MGLHIKPEFRFVPEEGKLEETGKEAKARWKTRP